MDESDAEDDSVDSGKQVGTQQQYMKFSAGQQVGTPLYMKLSAGV